MSKRDFSFNLKHLINYGLKIGERNNDKIISVLCTFCITFRREDFENEKKRPLTTKIYTIDFRCDNFSKHNKTDHYKQL